jgi:hypothetical protein
MATTLGRHNNTYQTPVTVSHAMLNFVISSDTVLLRQRNLLRSRRNFFLHRPGEMLTLGSPQRRFAMARCFMFRERIPWRPISWRI